MGMYLGMYDAWEPLTIFAESSILEVLLVACIHESEGWHSITIIVNTVNESTDFMTATGLEPTTT